MLSCINSSFHVEYSCFVVRVRGEMVSEEDSIGNACVRSADSSGGNNRAVGTHGRHYAELGGNKGSDGIVRRPAAWEFWSPPVMSLLRNTLMALSVLALVSTVQAQDMGDNQYATGMRTMQSCVLQGNNVFSLDP